MHFSSCDTKYGIHSRFSVGSAVVVVVGERVGGVVRSKTGRVVGGGAFVVVTCGHGPRKEIRNRDEEKSTWEEEEIVNSDVRRIRKPSDSMNRQINVFRRIQRHSNFILSVKPVALKKKKEFLKSLVLECFQL